VLEFTGNPGRRQVAHLRSPEKTPPIEKQSETARMDPTGSLAHALITLLGEITEKSQRDMDIGGSDQACAGFTECPPGGLGHISQLRVHGLVRPKGEE
jgi:hypothetical protein